MRSFGSHRKGLAGGVFPPCQWCQLISSHDPWSACSGIWRGRLCYTRWGLTISPSWNQLPRDGNLWRQRVARTTSQVNHTLTVAQANNVNSVNRITVCIDFSSLLKAKGVSVCVGANDSYLINLLFIYDLYFRYSFPSLFLCGVTKRRVKRTGHLGCKVGRLHTFTLGRIRCGIGFGSKMDFCIKGRTNTLLDSLTLARWREKRGNRLLNGAGRIPRLE